MRAVTRRKIPDRQHRPGGNKAPGNVGQLISEGPAEKESSKATKSEKPEATAGTRTSLRKRVSVPPVNLSYEPQEPRRRKSLGGSKDKKSIKADTGGSPTEKMEATNSTDPGCRICGIDDNYEKIILCDGCDGEYHLYCLSPPLSRVPKGDWYCGRCEGQKKNSRKTKKAKSKKRPAKRTALDLDSKTLDALERSILQTKPADELNEDELCVLMEKISRGASRRIEAARPSSDSDSSVDSEASNGKYRWIEEAIVVGREYFDELTSEVRDNGESLDNQTLTWLRQETGIHRRTRTPLSGLAPAKYTRIYEGFDEKKGYNGMSGTAILLEAMAAMNKHRSITKKKSQKRTLDDDDSIEEYRKRQKTSSNLVGLSDYQYLEYLECDPQELFSGTGTTPFAWLQSEKYRSAKHAQLDYSDYISITGGFTGRVSESGGSWLIHEFFYSDVDRLWFEQDTFAAKLCQLGVDPEISLPWKDKKIFRQLINNGRPRRFSRKFIESQMAELEGYRNRNRKKRHSQLQATSAGTAVTAQGQISRHLLPGKVISYDSRSHSYLVQFEDRTELCPDFEVSSDCGLHNLFAPGGLNACGFDSPADSLIGNPSAPEEDDRLVELLMALEMGKQRKGILLRAMATIVSLKRNDPENRELTIYYKWLTENLGRATKSVKKLLRMLQGLYGASYETAGESSLSSEKPTKEACAKTLLNCCNSIVQKAVDDDDTDMTPTTTKTSAGMLLTIADFGATVCDLTSKAECGIVETAFENATERLGNDHHVGMKDAFYVDAETRRAAAVESLNSAAALFKEALAMARSETYP